MEWQSNFFGLDSAQAVLRPARLSKREKRENEAHPKRKKGIRPKFNFSVIILNLRRAATSKSGPAQPPLSLSSLSPRANYSYKLQYHLTALLSLGNTELLGGYSTLVSHHHIPFLLMFKFSPVFGYGDPAS
jgi:hypothetical protein